MISLVLTGVSLGAIAVQWWYGQKTEALQRELEALQRQRDAILAADSQQRRLLLAPWLAQVRRLIDAEIGMRQQVEPELHAALTQARMLADSPQRPVGENALRRTVMDLEAAVGLIEAERAYLHGLLAAIPEEGVEAIFPLESLRMPHDYPAQGAVLQLAAGTLEIHGYALLGSHRGEPVAVHEVDHRQRSARLCPLRGRLLRLARDGSTPFEVLVEGRDGDEWRVSAAWSEELAGEPGSQPRLEFRLPARMHDKADARVGSIRVGSPLQVYSRPWTWAAIDAAARGGLARRLDVGLTPAIRRDVGTWSPIPLACTDEQLPLIEAAWERIEQVGGLSRPWRVALDDKGVFTFQLGGVELRMRCAEQCFELLTVADEGPRPATSVRIDAELGVFLPGQGDEQELKPGLFREFVEMLAEELGSQRVTLMDREAALYLRKTQVLFEDLRDTAGREARVEVFVAGTSEVQQQTVRCISLHRPLPAWLLKDGTASPRVEGVGADGRRLALQAWKVVNARLGLIEVLLCHAADAGELRYLASIGEGYTHDIMARSTASALADRFVSRAVRHQLFRYEDGAAAREGRHGLRGEPDTIIDAALAEEGVFAVWGPPGTGKTTLVVRLLRRYLADWERAGSKRAARVLVVAPTHVAVNEVLGRLLAAEPSLTDSVVRYVADATRIAGTGLEASAQGPLLESWRASALRPDSAVSPGWRALVEGGSRDVDEALNRWVLAGRQIHAVTSLGMPRADFALLDKTFDLVVFDEAGKAFAPEILLPAMRARRLVLVGDHKQLPPTVTEEMLANDGAYRLDAGEMEALLRGNYFERLFTALPESRKAMLDLQHRMHPHIGAAVSELFYDRELLSSRRDTAWEHTRKRLTVIDCSEVAEYRHHRAALGSLENGFERWLAGELLAVLSMRGSCLVVCPYQAQRAALEHEIQRRGLHRARATTVDAVQGGEADIVLLLMTRSSGDTSFLLTENRMNVALSRARECAIVIGHVGALTAQEGSPVARLLEHGRKARTLFHLRVPRQGNIQRDILKPVLSEPRRAPGPKPRGLPRGRRTSRMSNAALDD